MPRRRRNRAAISPDRAKRSSEARIGQHATAVKLPSVSQNGGSSICPVPNETVRNQRRDRTIPVGRREKSDVPAAHQHRRNPARPYPISENANAEGITTRLQSRRLLEPSKFQVLKKSGLNVRLNYSDSQFTFDFREHAVILFRITALKKILKSRGDDCRKKKRYRFQNVSIFVLSMVSPTKCTGSSLVRFTFKSNTSKRL